MRHSIEMKNAQLYVLINGYLASRGAILAKEQAQVERTVLVLAQRVETQAHLCFVVNISHLFGLSNELKELH